MTELWLTLAAILAYWLSVEIWALAYRLRFRRIEQRIEEMERALNRRDDDR